MKEGRTFPDLLRSYLPFLTWGAEYSPRTLANDLVAAAIGLASLVFLLCVNRFAILTLIGVQD